MALKWCQAPHPRCHPSQPTCASHKSPSHRPPRPSGESSAHRLLLPGLLRIHHPGSGRVQRRRARWWPRTPATLWGLLRARKLPCQQQQFLQSWRQRLQRQLQWPCLVRQNLPQHPQMWLLQMQSQQQTRNRGRRLQKTTLLRCRPQRPTRSRRHLYLRRFPSSLGLQSRSQPLPRWVCLTVPRSRQRKVQIRALKICPANQHHV